MRGNKKITLYRAPGPHRKRGIGSRHSLLRLLIRTEQGEILLIDLPPLVNIRVQIDLGCLDGGVAKIFLDYAEVLRALVEFTRIAVSDLMGGDPRGGIVLEDMLDGAR